MVKTLLGDEWDPVAIKDGKKFRLCGRNPETGSIFPLAFVRDDAPEGLDVMDMDEVMSREES